MGSAPYAFTKEEQEKVNRFMIFYQDYVCTIEAGIVSKLHLYSKHVNNLFRKRTNKV